MPGFIKYKRIQSPLYHFKNYDNKIVQVVRDEKLLVHIFKITLVMLH